MERTRLQSYWFYLPVICVLVGGYLAGSSLAFGVYFMNWLPAVTNSAARLILSLFGMGMLGADVYSSEYWARDIDESINEPSVLPHLLDGFGYATTLIGGGLIGVVF